MYRSPHYLVYNPSLIYRLSTLISIHSTMLHRAHPLGNLLSLGSVQLGRFVLNPKSPLQGFYDPLPDRPTASDYNTCSQSDVTQTETFAKLSKLNPYLSGLLSISCKRQSKNLTTIRSPLATTYELRNSSIWFEEACGKTETREWIGEAVNDDRDIYLVVGYLVVQDADISTWRMSDLEETITAQCPTIPLHNGAIATGLTPGLLGFSGTAHTLLLVFKAPGDQIYAVQYRKLKFKWFRHSESGSFLEKKSRWKFSMEWRGNDDGEDGEEILEASLEDDSEQEGLDEEIQEASHTIKDTSGDKVECLSEGAHACSDVVVAESNITHDQKGSRRKKARIALPKSRFGKTHNQGERVAQLLSTGRKRSRAAVDGRTQLKKPKRG